MTRVMLAPLLALAAGCDKQAAPDQKPSEPPTPPPAQLTCSTDSECVLRGKDPCNRCSTCAAFHRSEPAATCTGAPSGDRCDDSPCAMVEAACIKGACSTRPTAN